MSIYTSVYIIMMHIYIYNFFVCVCHVVQPIIGSFDEEEFPEGGNGRHVNDLCIQASCNCIVIVK